MAAIPPNNDTSNAGETSAERRDYYRISDRIGLEIQRRAPDQISPDSPFNDSHLEVLRAEFRRLDQDVRSHLANLGEKDRTLTSLIKAVNGKLDILARIMAFEQNPLQPEDWQQVTLSEGGLSFYTRDQGYGVGELLFVRMTLPPELFQPVATARVLSVNPNKNQLYQIHTEFVDIHDQDRQQIAKHVLRWQARQRQNG